MAEGYTGTLNVRCAVWADPGPSPIYTTADANGGSFSCDFDAGTWDHNAGILSLCHITNRTATK